MDTWAAARLLGGVMGNFTSILMMVEADNPSPRQVVPNGTLSYIDTGKSKFAVTCCHVYDEWLQRRESNPKLVLAVDGVGLEKPYVITPEIIDQDAELDLAVLKLQDGFVTDALRKWFYPAPFWPPIRPARGDVAYLLGYPGSAKMPIGDALSYRCVARLERVTSTNSTAFILSDENDDMVGDPQFVTRNLSWGGISGASVYQLPFQKPGSPRLLGFAYQANDNLNAIYVRHADFLGEDGMIRRE